MKQYTEMVLREPSVSLLNTADYQIGKKMRMYKREYDVY